MYQALYRKWRPRSFDDVISQPHITTALRNQIREEKTAHAYLFTGSRGTGKTTCARILAKTVNCEHRTPEGNPCLECEICRDAERGALADIIEIDAASNNSVEDIRDLREGTVYLPERCCYKVYIIDEVHMLSPSAWGALLKVMEEPPEYVKFILATTEVHKVPATIISRCQRYDFHRIRTADIAARLTYIAGEENLSLDPAAAQLIAHLSDGGMRDALSLLDQCASGGDAITAASVTAAAGVAGRDSVFAILEAVQAQDAAKALEITGALYDQSKDMVRLCDELLEQLRNMMLLKSGSGQPELLTCLPDEQPRLEELTRQPSLDTILRQIALLQDCRERMQRNPGKRVELEMALLQLAVPHLGCPGADRSGTGCRSVCAAGTAGCAGNTCRPAGRKRISGGGIQAAESLGLQAGGQLGRHSGSIPGSQPGGLRQSGGIFGVCGREYHADRGEKPVFPHAAEKQGKRRFAPGDCQAVPGRGV